MIWTDCFLDWGEDDSKKQKQQSVISIRMKLNLCCIHVGYSSYIINWLQLLNNQPQTQAVKFRK